MRHRFTRRHTTSTSPSQIREQLREKIANNLGIDIARIRYGNLGSTGRLGTNDPHWLIYYRDRWCELPWHFDGPLGVTRTMIRQWHG